MVAEVPMKVSNAVVLIREFFTTDGKPPDMAEMKKLTPEDREEMGTAIAVQRGGRAEKQPDGTVKYFVPA